MMRLLDKLHEKLTIFLLGHMRVKNHVVMIQCREHYLFLDYYGTLWKITPSHISGSPITIELVRI
jgi:hypothetical protein